MNLLFLSKDYPDGGAAGGVGTYTFEMSKLLSGLGHNIFVITGSRNGRSSEYIDNNGVHIFRVETEQKIAHSFLMERLQYSYVVSRKLRDVVDKYNIDIVEGREALEEAFWYFFFHRRAKKPLLVIKLHTPESIIYRMNQSADGFEVKMIRDLEEWWIRRGDQVIGLTKAVVDLTSKFFGMKLGDVPIVPNPIDTQFFIPNNEHNTDGYTVLYVGRLEFRKGVHVLMRAIPSVLKEIPEAKFKFIGSDCGMKHTLQNMIREYHCEGNVSLKAQISREDLKYEYQKAALCVIPSLWENHPYVCLEAMACGRPVIASDIAGIPEIIEREVSGILVPVGSSGQLANAIIRAFKNAELRVTLGKNARRRMEDYYSPQHVANQNLKIYEKLLERAK